MFLKRIPGGVHPILSTAKGQVELLAAAGFTRKQVAAMDQQRVAYVASGVIAEIEAPPWVSPGEPVSDDPIKVLSEMGAEEKARRLCTNSVVLGDFSEFLRA